MKPAAPSIKRPILLGALAVLSALAAVAASLNFFSLAQAAGETEHVVAGPGDLPESH